MNRSIGHNQSNYQALTRGWNDRSIMVPVMLLVTTHRTNQPSNINESANQPFKLKDAHRIQSFG